MVLSGCCQRRLANPESKRLRGIHVNRENFGLALERVLRDEHAHNKGIGTLKEKTLHAVLKQYLEPFEGSHEVNGGNKDKG